LGSTVALLAQFAALLHYSILTVSYLRKGTRYYQDLPHEELQVDNEEKDDVDTDSLVHGDACINNNQ